MLITLFRIIDVQRGSGVFRGVPNSTISGMNQQRSISHSIWMYKLPCEILDLQVHWKCSHRCPLFQRNIQRISRIYKGKIFPYAFSIFPPKQLLQEKMASEADILRSGLAITWLLELSVKFHFWVYPIFNQMSVETLILFLAA